MWLAMSQTLTNFSHEITVEYLLNGLTVQISQHVGIASTASFDVAARVDMQAAPGCSTIEFAHVVFTGVAGPESVLGANGETKVWLQLRLDRAQTTQSCDQSDPDAYDCSLWHLVQ